jgi:putative ABC transport system ATP-binding protein
MLLELREVTRTYLLGEVEVPALRPTDLKIDKGEFVGICGPSGSGKTTLLNMIGTIDAPSSGRIFIEGTDVYSLSDDEQTAMRNKTIGFIFQMFNLIPVLTALENVMLPLTFRKMPVDSARAKALAMLKAVGLEKHVQTRPSKLSGGQRQRIAIARALAQEPAIIIADEPTANLDSQTALQIMDIMRRMNEEQKITFIFSTHDSRLIKEVRRVIWLQDGAITEDRGNK